VRAGGPALYIAQSIGNLGASALVHAGERPAVVRIEITNGSERGVLVSDPSPISVPAELNVDATIISTIGSEYSLTALPASAGLAVLDVQGYARSPSGRAQLASSSRIFDVVKATEAELACLDETFVARQKERECVVTRGSRGATVWAQGVGYDIFVRAAKIANPIGAGDRFLAAYTVGRLRRMTPKDAGRFAAEHVLQTFVGG